MASAENYLKIVGKSVVSSQAVWISILNAKSKSVNTLQKSSSPDAVIRDLSKIISNQLSFLISVKKHLRFFQAWSSKRGIANMPQEMKQLIATLVANFSIVQSKVDPLTQKIEKELVILESMNGSNFVNMRTKFLSLYVEELEIVSSVDAVANNDAAIFFKIFDKMNKMAESRETQILMANVALGVVAGMVTFAFSRVLFIEDLLVYINGSAGLALSMAMGVTVGKSIVDVATNFKEYKRLI